MNQKEQPYNTLFATPPIAGIIADAPREEWLRALEVAHPDIEFKIGFLHLGSPLFRSEYPEMEIVSEYRPALRCRSRRYAVYARRREG